MFRSDSGRGGIILIDNWLPHPIRLPLFELNLPDESKLSAAGGVADVAESVTIISELSELSETVEKVSSLILRESSGTAAVVTSLSRVATVVSRQVKVSGRSVRW